MAEKGGIMVKGYHVQFELHRQKDEALIEFLERLKVQDRKWIDTMREMIRVYQQHVNGDLVTLKMIYDLLRADTTNIVAQTVNTITSHDGNDKSIVHELEDFGL